MKDMAMDAAIEMAIEAAGAARSGVPRAPAIRAVPAVVESPLPLRRAGMTVPQRGGIGES